MSLVVVGAAASQASASPCPNDALRAGLSRSLPDCRAYELVTPADMNGLSPTAVHIGNSSLETTDGGFDTLLASPSGNSVIFDTGSGSLPGTEGNGVFDEYDASRGAGGWATHFVAPSGAQSFGPHPGGVSPDHLFSFWKTSGFPYDRGSLQVDEGNGDSYMRNPDGSFEPIGKGSLGSDFEALGKWITPGAEHIIFSSRVQLEPDAPASGIEAVYDRSPAGPTHVVSLLPGDVTPGEDALYQGGSADGSTQAFKVGTTLYERRDNATTVALADAGSAPVGSTFACHGFPTEEVTLEYQWLRDGAPIAGATASSYTTVAADAGSALQCQVFAITSNSGATQTSIPAIVVAPSSGGAPPEPPLFGLPGPTPEGPGAGTLETCPPGEWTGEPSSFVFQWYSDGAPIPGATGETYEVQAADVPSSLQCAVTATNAAGSVTKLSSNLPTNPAPSPSAPFTEVETPVDLSVNFAGASRDGKEVFYEQLEHIFSFDTETQTTTTIAAGGGARIVLASPDGSRVYFASTLQLLGGEGTPGEENLYVWDRGTVRFIATLSPEDFVSFGGLESVNLGKWRNAVGPLQNVESGPASVPARSTPEGGVFVFQSHASLTSYDSEGHSEIYRYVVADGDLTCVSCDPLGEPPVSDASLQSVVRGAPTTALSHVANVTEDGDAVFFQTGDPLVSTDVDGQQDIYEWKGAQVSLITSGHSGGPNYLYGMTPDGHDVFFVTNDVLSLGDLNGNNQKIYDARVNGGFAESAVAPPCEADPCQGEVGTPPALPNPGSASFSGPPNPKPQQARKARRRHKKHRRGHPHKGRHHAASGERGGRR